VEDVIMRTPPITVRFSIGAMLAQPDAQKYMNLDGSMKLEAFRRLGGPRVHRRHPVTGELHDFAVPAVVAGAAPGALPEIILTPGNPSDYGPVVDLSANPLHVDDDGEVAQGQESDCYLLATGAAVGHQQPKALRSIITQLGPKLFESRWTRGGQVTRVRSDGTCNVAFAHPGNAKALWPIILEKGYACYRIGANTMSSLAYGYPGAVLSDMGYKTVINVGPNLVPILTLLMTWLSAKYPVVGTTYGKIPAGIPIVAAHCYEVYGLTADGGIVLRNPYNFDGGGSVDSNVWDGYVTLTVAQFIAAFTSVSVGTEPTFPILDDVPSSPATPSTPAPAVSEPAAQNFDLAALRKLYVRGSQGWDEGDRLFFGSDSSVTIAGLPAGTYDVAFTAAARTGVTTLRALAGGVQLVTTLANKKSTVNMQGVRVSGDGKLLIGDGSWGFDLYAVTVTPAGVPAPLPTSVYSVTVTAPGATPQTFAATKLTAVLADGTTRTIPEAA
jgi:hypothetical protein